MIIGDVALKKLRKNLTIEEGVKLKAYPDPKSKDGKPWTIGFGHTGPEVIEGLEITMQEALDLFEKDILNAELDINRVVIDGVAIYKKLNEARKLVLLDMTFNMGIPRLLKFKEMVKCLINEDYQGASREILDSEAARRLPSRYKLLAEMMEKGEA